jgi:hypothetical protein
MATKIAGGAIVLIFLARAAMNVAGFPDQPVFFTPMVGQEAAQ